MINISIFITAILLDTLIGDPRKLPHLVVGIAYIAKRAETKTLQRFGRNIKSGILFFMLTISCCLLIYFAVHLTLKSISESAAFIFDLIILFQCIAGRSLWNHIKAVEDPLLRGNLAKSRRKLAMIVGRDTADLNASNISRATIESAAESLCDGIIAPLFWFLILGPAGALLYRCINTLDSLVGYRNAKYELFGKFSARADDFMNFIPARISAFCILHINTAKYLKSVIREARRHESPNAGWPEAAMAHSINVRLGGSNSYDGEVSHGPVFNPSAFEANPEHIKHCLKYVTHAYCIFIAACLSLLGINVLIP